MKEVFTRGLWKSTSDKDAAAQRNRGQNHMA